MTRIDYKVRVSSRAKYVRLQIRPAEGLCVVIPRGYDPAAVPGLVREKRAWIVQAFKRMGGPAKALAPGALPATIVLPALAEQWRLNYPTGGRRMRLLENRPEGELSLSASVHEQDRVLAHLRRWLTGRARAALEPEVRRLADDHHFTVGRVTIRNQKARWGSCSASKNLSLNLKLLFLEPRQLEYVLLHELCHTRHMNHSAEFWRQVARCQPDHLAIRSSMRTAWRQVPAWV
jgi:predicted metal-dependent hydrolase